jgi:hypothetical protein
VSLPKERPMKPGLTALKSIRRVLALVVSTALVGPR